MINKSFDDRNFAESKIVLIDYGLVTKIGAHSNSGTPIFMHPIYWVKSKQPNIPQRDIYALCITFFMIEAYKKRSGKYPLDGRDYGYLLPRYYFKKNDIHSAYKNLKKKIIDHF